MSINFPTDPPQQRRKGGGGFFFLLIFGAIAFMVLRGMNTGPQPDDPNQPNRPSSESNRPTLEDDRYRIDPNFGKDQAAGSSRSNSSDWGMEDGPTQRNPASAPSATTQKTVKKKSSDWDMEEVSVQNDKDSSKNQFQFSDTDDSIAPASKSNKKTTKGDWGLEEVETK